MRARGMEGLPAAGIIAFTAVLAGYLAYVAIHPLIWMVNPVDLHIYQGGGLIVRHVRPLYDAHLSTPLYDWRGYPGQGNRFSYAQFTYPPFAAAVFALVSALPWRVLPALSVAANIALLLAALWYTARALGYRLVRPRLAFTMLAGAAVLWTEPVLRTVYLGQINLALMALILWDLTQPDTRASRWWKGAGVGIAAGVKLVPLIFIPYLLLSRKFRQAAVAAGTFAATVAAGFALLPADSVHWWLHGLFLDSRRAGFTAWGGNQSLQALLARLAHSVSAARPAWFAAAALAGLLGLVAAAVLSRAGHEMAGILTCALTGLLVSPVSWDHHWVWIAPGVAVAAHYAIQAMRTGPPAAWWRAAVRWPAAGFWALAASLIGTYGAWPDSLWGKPGAASHFALGLTWVAPNSDPALYYTAGDKPWFREYHWASGMWLAGNSYIVGGLVLMVILTLPAMQILRLHLGPGQPGPAGRPPAAAGS